MVTILVIILFLLLYKSRIVVNEDYLSIRQTTCVNGVFALFVFFRHICGYVEYTSPWDIPMKAVDNWLGQLIVVTFILYSGFGMAESLKKKTAYLRMIPFNRIFNVWLQFAICVTLYIAIKFALGTKFPAKKVILGYVGWESVGNSNWYIFTIIMLWIGTWAVFSLFKNRTEVIPYIAMVVYSLLYIVLMKAVGRPSYCYNTVLAYNIGMFISLKKSFFDKILRDSKKWLILTSMFFIIFGIVCPLAMKNTITMQANVFLFSALIVLFTMRVKLDNPMSYWLGKNLFGIYILQRIPMLIFSKIVFLQEHIYIYTIACAIATLLLAWIFGKLYSMLWGKLKAVYMHNKA